MSIRRGFTLVEGLVGVTIFFVVLMCAYTLFNAGNKASATTITANATLQNASRKAMMDFLKEVRESIEVMRPAPGASLTYFVARGKVNDILTGYQVQNAAASAKANKPLYDLYLHRWDPTGTPQSGKPALVVGGIERLTFSTSSTGLLHVNLELFEDGRTSSLITAVRTRGIGSEAGP